MGRDTACDMHQAFVQAFIRNDQGSMAALQGGESQVRKLVNDPRVTRVGKLLAEEQPGRATAVVGASSKAT